MPDNKITLKTVVSGNPIFVEYSINSDFQGMVEKAIDKAGVKNKTAKDYVVKLDNQEVKLNEKLKDYNYSEDSILYLDLETGGGGSIE